MGASSRPPADPKSISISTLGADILYLIAEQLWLLHPEPPIYQESRSYGRELDRYCLCFKAFDDALAPFRYRTIKLTSKLVDNIESSQYTQVLSTIYKHTRHLVFLENLNYEKAIAIMSRSLGIHTLTSDENGLNTSTLDLICNNWPTARLRLINCASYRRSQLDYTYLPLVALQQVVYIHFDHLEVHNKIKDPPKLVASTPNLESLHLSVSAWDFSVPEIVFPPIRELSIDSFASLIWKGRSNAGHASLWNFSRLESFTLRFTKVNFFFTAFENEYPLMPELKRLKFSYVDVMNEESTIVFRRFLSVPADLEELEVRCCFTSLEVASLAINWRRLRTLRVHDGVGYSIDSVDCPTYSLVQLERINHACPLLRTFGLDLPFSTQKKNTFLDAIVKFRNVDTLYLHVATRLDEDETTPARSSVDYEYAKELVDSLCLHKSGVPFKKICIDVNNFRFRGLMRNYENYRKKIDRIPERYFRFQISSCGGFLRIKTKTVVIPRITDAYPWLRKAKTDGFKTREWEEPFGLRIN